MNKKLITFVLLLFTFFSLFKSSMFEVRAADADKDKVNSAEVVSKKLDKEAQILQKYLAGFNSPMKEHAQDFVDAAKKYNLDWKLLPAIAGVESTFGKQIPGGYNAYGWGVYDNQAIYFTSWTDGIYTVAKGLRENYLDKGLTTPKSMNRIYAESPTWGSRVTYFMEELEKFASKFVDESEELAEIAPDSKKTAAISASLAR